MELSWPEAFVASVAIVSVAAVVVAVIWQVFATGRAGITASNGRQSAAPGGAEAAADPGGGNADESHPPARSRQGT